VDSSDPVHLCRAAGTEAARRQGGIVMEEKQKRKPGEQGFALILLVASLLVLVESIRMFQVSPKLSSYGGLPLILSILMTLFMGKVILFENRRMEKPETTSPLDGIRYVFSKDVAVFTGLILLYCIALYFRLGFLVCTPIFLFVSMQFFIPRGIKNNIIYSAVLTAAVYVVFTLIFRVQLP